MSLYEGPLWQEFFYQKPLSEFSRREVFTVISSEMAREHPRPTEFNRALHELGRLGIIVSVNTLDETACL